ncbi:MAG TPA: ABC transporter permease [Methanocorpusculum sp.]|nr:ABC transporter permease [Methanocorpusculum sp.]
MQYIEPLIFVGIFGALAVSFLWLRDARIFARTGLPGYRSAAYKGVLFTALAWFGAALCSGMIGGSAMIYLGIGLILIALFLHSKVKKEDVWTGNESGWQRFIGSAPRQNNRR